MQLIDRPVLNDRAYYTVGETADFFVDIVPMIYNHRVVLTPKLPDGSAADWWTVGWCYPTLLAAVAAVTVWDPAFEAEPVGYIKRVGG